jgi:hypothetical protein
MAIAVGAVVLLGLVLAAGFAVIEAGSERQARDAEAAALAGERTEGEIHRVEAQARTRKAFTRLEFRNRFMGQTPDEVAAALGRPDETSEEEGVVRWTYRDRVRDPAPGQAPATPVMLVFRNGKVTEVRY